VRPMNSRVFLLEPTKANIDLTSALTFGDLIYIFPANKRRCSVFNSSAYCKAVINRLAECEFHKDNDYICAVGSMISVTTAVIAVAQLYENFNVLLFNSVEDSYVARRFSKEI